MSFKMKKWHLNRGYINFELMNFNKLGFLEILRILCPVQRSQILITIERRGRSDTVCSELARTSISQTGKLPRVNSNPVKTIPDEI